MRWSGRRARWILGVAALAPLCVGSPVPDGGSALGVGRAEAQLAVDQRVARGGPSRSTPRQTYALPTTFSTVVAAGMTYYVVQEVYFEAVMKGGEVVYQVVEAR